MADNTTLPGTGDVYASDDIGGIKHQRVKISIGADGSAVDASSTDPLPSREEPFDAISTVYEDASFVVGESPRTLDVNTDLGRDGRDLVGICDGAGDIKIATSNDGITFGDDWTMRSGEVLEIRELVMNKVRITHVSDSSYRIMVT